MNSRQWRQIEDLFHAARQCGPAQCAALLETAEPDIRERVQRMLAVDSNTQILDQPAAAFLESTRTVITTGSQLGPYAIEFPIGAGGMGTVYRALDTRLQRTVALKIVNDRHSWRFQSEALAISSLNHPHVCTLYDVGPNYLVMEFIEGSTLADEIKKGPLAPILVMKYGAQIAGALAEAHARGIIHRDLKPANIMLTSHGVKVLDFGLAKLLSTDDLKTDAGAIMGTPAYMAPEQIQGREPAPSTDLFALGLIIYEMSIGRLPFPGYSLGKRLVTGLSASQIPRPSSECPAIPARFDRVVARLLKEDPTKRSQSAAETEDELLELAESIASPPTRARSKLLLASVIACLLVSAVGLWYYQRVNQRDWVHVKAVPEIERLAPNAPLAAFLLLQKAQSILPLDPQLAATAKSHVRKVSVRSSPSGAAVAIQDYLEPNGAWLSLGTTPIAGVSIPRGYFRWKVSKPGSEQVLVAPLTQDEMNFALGTPEIPAGMVPVPKQRFAQMIDFIGWLNYSLPAFYIDKFEVTNRQFQEFVDQGGYRKPQYWKQAFVKDGKEISWDQAMDLLRDSTGRAGPSTWAGGHFPPGREDYPVSGVSWYEAAAFAEFAGKSLPVMAQWYQASSPDVVRANASLSNFGGGGLWRVGHSPDVGPFGTYDMSGNVREWCFTSIDTDRRFILGGAWKTQIYQAINPEALPPFDRSELNGFRCVKNKEPLPADAIAPLVRNERDLSKVTPVADDVFQAYRNTYAYDQTPLKLRSEGIVEDSQDWTKEKVSIDAGYEDQRLPMYLFLPKRVHPPFQAVVFFPSARIYFLPSSQVLGDLDFVDYVIRSGRALLYPIYSRTYERPGSRVIPGTNGDLLQTIERSKEVRRSIDYLESRPDIDHSKIAYFGVSQGAAYGVIYAALEPRFKAIVFVDGGLFLSPTVPPRDQVNFAPRITQPVLMLNGKYDFTFSPDRAQNPLFNMLGTPQSEKRHRTFDTPHDMRQNKSAMSSEVLAWFDKYLGKVQ